MNVFDDYDSFADHADTTSSLLFEAGAHHCKPLVSIIIPTYRRPALLLEALHSALAQHSGVACEILIISNDIDENRNNSIVDNLPRKPVHGLRLYANTRNIGMFPNWNRGIELARGEWATILNDDDVLYPDFLDTVLARIHDRPEIDGLVCRTAFHDCRASDRRRAQPRSLLRKLWRHVERRRYDRNGLAQIGSRQLFFGNELSNSLGFLFKREIAVALGGFRVSDAPSADYLFYARFAAAHGLFVLNEVLASVGLGENESLRPEVMIGFMTQGDRLRGDMAGRHVPESWLKMSPLIVATAVAETNRFWHGQLDPQAVERKLGFSLPSPNRTKLNLLRLLHRAL